MGRVREVEETAAGWWNATLNRPTSHRLLERMIIPLAFRFTALTLYGFDFTALI